MDGSLAKLEATIAEIHEDLRAIRLDLAEIKKLIAALPTTFQFVYIQAALILVIFGAAFGLLTLVTA